MFSKIKTFFSPLGFTQEEHEFGESVDGTANIRQMKNGKYRLLVNGNEVIGTYSRHRDAVRGAARRGLSVS